MLELIFQGFMEWAYGLALECWEYFSSSLLDIMSMDYAYMKSHVPVMVSIAQVLLAVGWALLIGNLVFQALKSMAVGLGFEGEDPKLLFTRTFVFAFLLMASPQICEVGLSLTARIIELLEIPDAINVTLVDERVFGSLGAAWLLVIIFGLIIMFKVFRLLLEIAERYVILAVLTMTAPLAFAMGGSKSTSEIFGGWCRMFGSMCTLMVTNVIFFKMLLSVLSNVPSGLDIIPWIVLVLTIVKVARKADAIITRIGLNPAITGDSLGRGFPGTLTYMVMRSATSHITKTIGKSTGKGNRGAASGSTTGGPRIGGGPSGAHNAAGHTASYQAYQATQQQNTSQGAEGQGFVSQRESVQSGGAQTATQEHFSSSSMQNTSSIRQAAFRGSEARKSSVPSGMRRAPAYVTSVDRVSPSNAQTPAAGNDTSGNRTTSTVREQSNVTASIRTANVEKRIVPFFRGRKVTLGGLRAGDIQDFYTYCATELEISNNTIIKYHANISKALNDAVRLEKIPMTPLKRGMRPKQVEHIGKFYTLSEVEHLLSCVKGDGTEFPVLMAAFYGLRRSEIMGLKWDSIDFDANTITIAHVVVEISIDGKDTIVAKDRPKNKKSYRTLPLVPEYRRLLLQMKKHQEEYRELCGNCYHESDYIYVNDLGEPIRPNYVSQHFKLLLKNNNLREITFHELRHTCASLLLKSGISMKDIQAWLGHSNYNTTANIYAHLESSSKEITGNAMQDNFTISANLAAREAAKA